MTNRIEVNEQQALDRFLRLAAIAGTSGQEWDVAQAIIEELVQAGLDRSAISFDNAHERTEIKGNCGNLIVTLPGAKQGPATLLSAHMDTVPICVGSDPVVEGDRVSSRGETGLGADNRAGCAAIVTGAVERLRSGGEVLPPAKLLLTVQEEVGLKGASNLDVGQLGRVDRAVNFDGGAVEKVTTGAIGGERMSIRVLGVPAHAGAAPEKGASAVVTAARAIADLSRDGWLGLVQKGDRTGTANIGVIRGGEATNVVTPEVTLKAEARSHQAGFRAEIVQRIREAFDRAAAEVCNDEGAAARCEFESRVDYEAFRLAEGDPSVAALETVLRQLGRTPLRQVANGGLDANWLNQHGVAAVTAGCGQMNIHTAEEQLSIPDYLDACRIAAQLLGPHSSR